MALRAGLGTASKASTGRSHTLPCSFFASTPLQDSGPVVGPA